MILSEVGVTVCAVLALVVTVLAECLLMDRGVFLFFVIVSHPLGKAIIPLSPCITGLLRSEPKPAQAGASTVLPHASRTAFQTRSGVSGMSM